MKKLMIVIFMCLILVVGKHESTQFTLLDYFIGDYTAYTSSEVDSDSVNLGFCYMNSKPISKHLVGESIILKDCEAGAVIKTLNANVVKKEWLEDGTVVIYAYSSLIEKQVKVENKNVNLQIAIKENSIIVGWPLILGSF